MPKMFRSALWLSLATGVWSNRLSTRVTEVSSYPPVATLSSSSGQSKTIFVGRALPEFNQDLFLGIKYADQPVRFMPAELKSTYASNDSPSGAYDLSAAGVTPTSETIYYNATAYGYDCPGYGSDTTKLVAMGLIQLSEDCMNLNVIRPQTTGDELLPVLLWIFGGGWTQGATADPRYNMSYIVQQSALNGKPVLGVSINYRLAAFGFLDSVEVRAEGHTNLALRDQRTAMRWVKQHIQEFGGDPERITIWGESAGAYSVGAHLVTNQGDNEGLFRAGMNTRYSRSGSSLTSGSQTLAIMESGNAIGPPYNGTEWHQPMYNRIVERTGCTNSTDTLQCLRDLPYETIYSNAYEGLEWFATIDGIFLTEYPQISYREGKLAKVPILLGTNTDEGTSFGTTGTDTDEECIEQLISSKRWLLTRAQATKLLTYYPNIPALGCPYGWGNVTWPSLGLQYKRYESMAGDISMFAPRRMLAQIMSRFEDVYSYRWDVAALNTSTLIGVQHFAEIPFVFANPVQNITALGSDPARLALGQMAARMWTSFVTDLHPNGHGVPHIPHWPRYSAKPANFVFRLSRNESYVEVDTYRASGMEFINSLPR
ncbi:uncharacterized protein N7482_001224 [Penicillium canariense]|uniref:Carboxylic ester hydrolase n=1 Tax=Penicillium canariense TaxID=189055 RepID=A0A9W9IFD4_9EURO|nr:uncharacterized protein N7482_001224 [Penicillium canariense]KAJ5175347.1 hypothetical protein N7482_001224 [Penicillium canariense]